MNNDKLDLGVSREGNGAKEMIADVIKFQQAQYKREDLPLLEALGLANAFLTAQYNLGEEK